VNIVYAGQPLESGRQYFWKVRIRDEHGILSAWSGPASWTMGLLDDKDWQGQWIGAEDKVPNQPRHFFAAVERNAAAAITPAGAPALYLRREATLPETSAARDRLRVRLGYFEFYLNGKRVGDRVMDPIFTDYSRPGRHVTFDVTALLQAGPNAWA